MDGGTGCVHTATGHGEDDYRVGLKYNLDVIMPVDERGCYDELVVGLNLLPDPEEFVGVHIFKANERILRATRGESPKGYKVYPLIPTLLENKKASNI